MTDPALTSRASLYAMKLIADPADPARLAGRLEHVLSGRRHDFDDGQALLAVLAREQIEGYSIAMAGSPGPARSPGLPKRGRS